ncbi:MAG: OsmC family protein [Rhodospirillaceae bacterium]|nr:OsmC family protein [Rhodospirillaceae bacterium]
MSQTTTQTATTEVNNGVNVEALLGAREALDAAPEAAQFKWRTTCEWVNGTHSRSTISSFFGLGAEQSRDRTFSVESDHPEVFAAEDNAATPVEIVLSGLASCLTAGVAAVGQHRGIQLHSVKATVEGDMDIQGILGIDDEVRNGFGTIRVHFEIDADATDDEIKALVAQSQKRSAVFDIIPNPTNVVVTAN